MSEFEVKKAEALAAVRTSKCVGKYLHVPVEHMATITKALQSVGTVGGELTAGGQDLDAQARYDAVKAASRLLGAVRASHDTAKDVYASDYWRARVADAEIVLNTAIGQVVTGDAVSPALPSCYASNPGAQAQAENSCHDCPCANACLSDVSDKTVDD